MKILVTGCYGFIPSHVVDALHRRGHQVIGLARHNQQSEAQPDVLYLGDIRDKDLVEKAVSMSDGVINLAGILGTQETIANPYPSVHVNILGALNVLEACRIWSVPLVQIAVGNHWMNNSYSITKTAAERLTLMYVTEHGVRATVVRALNAYGPRQKAKPVRKMMASFITRALRGEPIEIYGDGEQRMDFVYVRDVAEILTDQLELLTTPDAVLGRLLEAGTGEGPSVNDLAALVVKLSGSASQVIHLPMRPGEPPHSAVIASDPFAFPYTAIETGLIETITWYQTHL